MRLKVYIPSVPANFIRSIQSYSPVKPIPEVMQGSFTIKPQVRVIENNKAFHVPSIRSHRERERSELLDEQEQSTEKNGQVKVSKVRYLGTIPSHQKYKASQASNINLRAVVHANVGNYTSR